MGRFSPAWASALLAAFVLVGLAFVSVTPAEPQHEARSVTAARPAALAEPVRAVVASSLDRSVVRAAVARHTAGRYACRSGRIALTFDDGPNPAVTPKLVRTLVRLKVPATFFMIGNHVDAHPALARLVQRNGFTIGNHTWNHPQLTHLSAKQIRHQLRATSAAFKRNGIKPSRLMRPPYGDINDRVRKVIRWYGMIPVLWTIDSRDWAGGSSVAIANRILSALRRHGTNLVLQHDGVDNSPASAAAVPIVVRRARARGYCFTQLNARGGVGSGTAPTSAKRIRPAGSGSGHATSTATRAVATATTTSTVFVSRPKRLMFVSRAAMRMPRSAYLRVLLDRIS